MKRILIVCLLASVLSGCSRRTFETVMDTLPELPVVLPKEIRVQLPETAAQPVFESEEAGKLYFCEGYEIILRTVEGGDLQKTIAEISGYNHDRLTIMTTRQAELEKYEFVWSAAGESTDRVGRAAILDDGNYHYILSVMADSQWAGELQQTWQDMFATFTVVSIAQ